jgi:hypothetical protein
MVPYTKTLACLALRKVQAILQRQRPSSSKKLPTHNIGPYEAIQVGPTFSVPVFDPTLIRGYRASGHRLLARRTDEQMVREETVLLTVSEYMAHLRALAGITAAASRVELATRLAYRADDLPSDGVTSKFDVSRARVRLREEQQILIDARRDADTTGCPLKRILNLSDSLQIEFADRQDFFQTLSVDLSDPWQRHWCSARHFWSPMAIASWPWVPCCSRVQLLWSL